MTWNLLFVVNSVLLGVGLAMDAFSVSLVNGFNEPMMKRGKRIAVPGTFAFFQFLMPMTGWVCVRTVLLYFSAFQKFIPWIALALLLYIGGSMVWEGLHQEEGEKSGREVSHWGLLLQGIATSIDALSVGFTIADYGCAQAVLSSLIIAGVTYLICASGLYIGRKMGTKLSDKAAIFGGVILIGIGIEIFVTGIF